MVIITKSYMCSLIDYCLHIKRSKLGLCLTFLAFWALSVSAQNGKDMSCQPGRLLMEIHFPWDKSQLDTLYMNNNQTLRRMRQLVDSIGVNRIDSVVVVSQSSPEGSYLHNQKLSNRRALSMRRYMETHYPLLADKLTVNPDGESWMQLREWVRVDKKLKQKTIERILNIIDDQTISIDTKKWRITNDPVYRYLYRTYYPRIRNSMVCMLYVRNESFPPITAPSLSMPLVAEQDLKLPVYSPEKIVRDTFSVAVKTNLLYDLATALNVEIEVPIKNHWSVVIEDVFPWWERGNKYCFQLWEMGVEGRYWLSDNKYHRQKLSGHFVGGYVMSGKYDFQWKRRLNYQGEFWSVGATYGYTMPIGKRFKMEFSASVGYLSTEYRHYRPSSDYGELIKDPKKQGRLGYVGPTKLKVSLVYPLHFLVKKKGGCR